MNFRDQIQKALSVFQRKGTEMPDLGQYAYSHEPMFRFTGWGWNRGGSTPDYKREVGDLDLNSLAMAVVNFTSSRIPEAKPVVVRTTKQGDEEKDYLHPLAQLIRRPNKHHIWANYAAACSMSWWFSGNVYFYKSRSVTGEVQELWYLPHFLVQPRWPNDGRAPEVPADQNNDPFLSHYQYNPPGKEPVLYPASDIVHLKRGVNLNSPREGLGAFESLFKELYGDDKMALFTASIMANMGIQVPLISPADKDVTIGETKAKGMVEKWKAKTTGANAGEPVVLTEPIKVEKFGFTPSELDLSSLRMIPESRVCAVCQISPAALQLMIGLENGTSYASSEQARQQGYEEVIIPIQSVWAEEFTWQLLPDFKGSEGAEFAFDTSKVRVLEEDKDALVKRESEVFRSGATTIDQFFTAIGKKPLGAPLGDFRMVPSLATPMAPDRFEDSGQIPEEPDPLDASVISDTDKLQIAKMADIDRWMDGLERQMQEFLRANPR